MHDIKDGLSVQAEWLTTSLGSSDHIKSLLETHTKEPGEPEHRNGMLSMVVQDRHGTPTVTQVGFVANALERENYSPDVVEAFDIVARAIASENPPGRLTLINGPPGTGKTYFVRGLLAAVRSDNLLLSASILRQVDVPALSGMFLDFVDYRLEQDMPIVLVIEDGDEALLPRGVDNMGTISTLLNLSDGLLGAVKSVHIIITTNAKKLEIEDALLRPGRLLKNVTIGPLELAQAQAVYTRLGGKHPEELHRRLAVGGKTTLAEIYALIHGG